MKDVFQTLLNAIQYRLKLILDQISDIRSRAVQSDYTQNDPMANNYIQNRPFYEKSKVVLEVVATETGFLLPETTYEIGKTYAIEVNGKRTEKAILRLRTLRTK